MKQSNFPDLDLNHLFTMDALFKSSQVSKAAKLLGVTQPAVSHSLKTLRAYFEDELLVRSEGLYRLTPKAQELKTSVARIVSDIQTSLIATHAFEPSFATSTFTICVSDLAEFLFLRDFLAEFMRLAPSCRVRCLRAPVEDIPQLLESGRADIALGGMVPEMPSTLRQKRMFDYDYVCIGSQKNRVLKQILTRATYCESPHVIVSRSGHFDDFIEPLLKRISVQRNTVVSISHNWAVANLVSQSGLIATVPRLVAPRFANHFPLGIAELPFKLPHVVSRMYWHERVHKDAANVWLRGLAVDHFSPAF